MTVQTAVSTFVVLAGVAMADEPIVYSGPNRNISYSQFEFNDTICLFDSPGTWDDLSLCLDAWEMPDEHQYGFGTLLEVHGNHVQFALGGDSSTIKRFSYGDIIGSSQTYSGNSYVDFSRYFERFDPFPFIDEYGEFRNTTGYAGILLVDGTTNYYGWIQVSVVNNNNMAITGTLVDWAYNSIPDCAIRAGVTNVSPTIRMSSENATITWPTVSNLVYQLQGADTLQPPAWSNIGAQITGDGTTVTQSLVTTGANGYYRAAVTLP